ncbi:MAG: response regulator [Verrucomicrobiota bacterium]
MKKILIIEDEQIVANVYRNKLVVEGYQAEIALDGESGLKLMHTFQPDAIVLDLILPKMSGLEVIKKIRSEPEYSEVPIIVLSNTYLTNLIQDAWKAGATKCVSKINCSPQDLLVLMRRTIGGGEAVSHARRKTEGASAAKPAQSASEADAEFQAEFRATFVASLPATLTVLRTALQSLIKSDTEAARLEHIHELYLRIHRINSNAGIAGLVLIAHLAAAFEALLKELCEKPKNISASILHTVAAAVDFLDYLFKHGIQPEKQDITPANILVVDDEALACRTITYALKKAQLQSVSIEDPNAAFRLLSDNQFDLVFLDVDMPGMTGYELCNKLRSLPMHKKTPVVFVTRLDDFNNRTKSMVAGGNDFIAKPFLFIELTVKALIHVLRGKLQKAK